MSSAQSYDATATSNINDFTLSIAGVISGNITAVEGEATANNPAQAAADVRYVEGSVTPGFTFPVGAAHADAPPTDHGQGGLSNVGLPGAFTMSALSGVTDAWGYANACPSPTTTPQNDGELQDVTQAPGDQPIFADGSRLLSKAKGQMGGMTVGPAGLLGEFKAFTTYGVTSLTPIGADAYGIQSTVTAEVSSLTFLSGVIGVSWGGFTPYVKAVATGQPGGAYVDYSVPSVQVVAGGAPVTINPGGSQTFGNFLTGQVSISVGQPTNVSVAADGTSAHIEVTLLTIDVRGPLGVPRATYRILPMIADAQMEAGDTAPGIQCDPQALTMTPTQGPTAGGTTVTITGENFAQGATSVEIGGITVPATVSNDGKSLTFVTPPHAEGPVPVKVITPEGTVDVATPYTYIPPAPTITGPTNGSSVSDPTPPITGTGYPGSTIEVVEGGVTLCTATVAANGTWTCTPTTPLDPGPHTIVANQTTPSGTEQPSPPVTFTVIDASMTLDKSGGTVTDLDGNGTDVGDTITYTFTVTNTGDVPLTGVQVSDPLIAPTAFTCGSGNVAVGGTLTCTRNYTLTQADVNAGEVNNSATAQAPRPGGGDPVIAKDFTTTDTGAAGGSLTTSKTAALQDEDSDNLADAGEEIDYTITTTNNGQVRLDNVTVSDPKLASLTCEVDGAGVTNGSFSLEPGDSVVCTGTYEVTQTDVDTSDEIANTATATGDNPTDPATDPTTTPDTVTVPTDASSSLSVTKTADLVDGDGDDLADAGETINYTVTVTNSGSRTLTGVTVNDPLLPGMTCSPTTLAAGDEAICTGTYTVTQADVDNGAVHNTATASATGPDGSPVNGSSDEVIQDADTRPALTTGKTAALVDADADGLADVGETINYTITIENTGTTTLTGVTADDPMLTDLNCPPTDLAVGAVLTCTGSHTVTQADLDAGSVVNTAVGTGVAPDGSPVTDPSDPATVDTDSRGALTTTKTAVLNDADGDNLADPGEAIAYTVTTKNTGAVTLNDVEVTDTKLTAGLTCTVGGAAATNGSITLAPGAEVVCTGSYTVTQADVDSGEVANTATATGTNPADPGTDPTTIPGGTTTPTDTVGALTVTKTANLNDDDGDNLADVGETIDYTITVTNTGSPTISDVSAVDPRLGTLTCTVGGTATPNGSAVLAHGQSLVCTGSATVTQADVDAGAAVNTATATGTNDADPGTDPVVTPGGSDVPTDTLGSVSVAKSAELTTDADGDGEIDLGDQLTYTVTVTNTGSTTLSNVVVTDPLVTLTCDATTVAPADELTCTGVYTVTQADVDNGGVTNKASVTAENPVDPGTPVTGDDEITTDVSSTPAVTTVKTGALVDGDGDGLADVGETIDYTITVTNSGTTTLNNVQASDPKVGALSCTPALGSTLAPGAALTCTASYPVTQADVDAGGVVNVATGSGTTPGGTPVTDPSDPVTTDADDRSELTTTKTGALVDADGDGLADVGETINYSITVTNTGAVTLDDVRATDPKVGALSCTPAQGSSLAPGAALTCTAAYTVTQADVDAGGAVNVATGSGTTPDGTPVTDPSDPVTTDTDTRSELSTAKTGVLADADGDGLADVGESIDYTITVTNTGTVAIDDVHVDDPKVGALSCTPAQGSDLAPGAAITCTAAYTVTQADVDAGGVLNVATGSGTGPEGPVTDPSDPVTTDADLRGQLTTVKTGSLVDADGDGMADEGETIDYTITVTNSGTATITDVQVDDPLVGALNCTPALGSDLAPGDAITCTTTYTVTQADIAAGSVVNVATGSGTTPDGTPVTDDSDPVTTDADSPTELTTTKTGALVDGDGDGVADVGETIDYTITVTNTGEVAVDDVQVSDPKVGALNCTPALGSTLAPGDAMTCTATYVVTQADIDAGGVVNIATGTGTGPEGPVTDPSDPVTTETEDDSELTTVKTGALVDGDGDGLADVGESIDYTITVTNTGAVTVTNVTVTDPKVGALNCTPALGSSLAPGDFITCTATYVVTQADVDSGSVDNTATAGGQNPADPGTPPTSPPGGTTTPTDTTGGLTAVKTGALVDGDSDGLADVGETIDYTIVVTNTGKVTLSDVRATDPKVGALSCTPAQGSSLAPGAALTCTASYTVTQADVDAGGVVNVATGSGTTPDGTPVTDDSDPVTTDADDRSELTTVKTGALVDGDGDDLADVGETINYTISVTNSGTVTVESAQVSDPKLGALVCTPAQGGDLAPGAGLVCVGSYVVTQADVEAGGVVNVATGSGTTSGGTPVTDPSDPVTTDADVRAELTTVKTGELVDADGDDLADVGETIDYTITLTNSGTVAVNDVQVTDPLVGALNCTPALGADLAPGAELECTASYVVTQADVDAGGVVNVATGSGTGPQGPVTDPSDPVTTDADASSELTTAKSGALVDGDGDGLADVGEAIDYTITVTNTGKVTVTDVQASDPKVGALNCTPALGSALAPGDAITCTATYVVTQADVDAGGVVNVATGSGTTPEGPITDPSDPVTTDTEDNSELTTVKTAALVDGDGDGLADAGESIDYTIVVTNTGAITVDNVQVSDPLVGALACTPALGSSLAPGAAITCTASYVVTQADVDAGSVDNTATSTGDNPADPGTPPTTPPGGTTTPTDTAGGLTTVKTGALVDGDGDALADVGESIDYTITVTNTGAVTVSDVQVSDPKVGALNCTPVLGSDLAPNAAITCTATYTVTQADIDAGGVVNVATGSGTTPDSIPVTDDSDPVTTDADDRSELTTGKTGALVDGDGDGLADVGESIDYTITVTNTGNVTVTDVQVSDPKVGALACTPAVGSDLAPNDAISCTATYVVTQADVDAGGVVNIATGSGTTPEGPVTDPSDPVTTESEERTELTTTKTGDLVDADGDELADVGEMIDYTITVTNTGTVTVTDVQASDPRVGALNCTPALGSDLAPGDAISCTATYTVTQADIDAGGVVNIATGSATGPNGPVTDPSDPVTTDSDASSELTTAKSGALVDADGDNMADVGETIDYTITVTNTGKVTVTDVQVSDPLVGALNCTPALGSALAPGAAITCTASYTVTQADVDAGGVVNVATGSGTTPEGPVTDPSDPVTTDTDDRSELTTVKTGALVDGDGDGLADLGESINYTITVTNTGAITVDNVQVSDPKVGALNCAPALGSSLAPGAAITCTAAYVVTQADVDAGSVDNTAVATGDNPVDPGTPPTSPPGGTTTPTDTTGGLSTVKAGALVDGDGDGLADVGETIDYTIAVTNTGAVTIDNVQVSDPKLGTLNCTPAQGSSLAPGAAITCTASYTVTQADVDAGGVVNVATGSGTTPGGTPVTVDSPPVVTTTDSRSELTTVKTGVLVDGDSDGLADLGETIDYTITVTNTGATTVDNVRVSDPKVGALTCTPAQGSSLAPGAAITCTAAYVVTQADVDAGSVDNTATATGENPVDPGTPPTSPPGGTTTPTDTTGELTTVKTGELVDADGDGLADVGETIDYTIVVTNTGAVTLDDVQVNDPKIADLTCAPGQGSSLAPGDDITCTASYVVTQADVDSGSVHNTASATGVNPVDPETPPTSPGGVSDIPADTEGTISTTKVAELRDADGDDLADAGEVIGYTITVANTGSPTVESIEVDDPRVEAAGLALTCTVDGEPFANGEIVLHAGESVSCVVDYSVTPADVAEGEVLNTASATGTNVADPEQEPTDPGEVTTPTDTSASVALTKTAALEDRDGDDQADAGETIRYTLTVTNTGGVNVEDVRAIDPMLDEAGVTLSCTVAGRAAGDGGVTLAPGEQLVCLGDYTVTAADLTQAEIVNVATATAVNPVDPDKDPATVGAEVAVPVDDPEPSPQPTETPEPSHPGSHHPGSVDPGSVDPGQANGPRPETGGKLAETGSSSATLPALLGAIVLLTAGLALIITARRRRTQ